jgi:SAM-dependent methyltransferase
VDTGSSLSADLERIYSRRFDADESYRDLVWKTLISHWFQKYIAPDASILDLGCGYGQFINNVRCSRKYAMDLNPGATRRLNPDVTVLAQDCNSRWDLPDGSLDLVFSSNFFEHLLTKSDLVRAVAEAQRCLRDGGRLVAMGPNVKLVGGAYWDYFDHHLALTERSMSEAFETAGLRTELVLDRFLPYTMVDAWRYPGAFVRMYLQMPLLWKVFGKQFLVIAAK